ncbi:hypothetical protein BgiBS90_015781 [Biomphalaria glabrata]|nr:hypothetical protein BgiBS90_015781 [Biomphalaria glabrata]
MDPRPILKSDSQSSREFWLKDKSLDLCSSNLFCWIHLPAQDFSKISSLFKLLVAAVDISREMSIFTQVFFTFTMDIFLGTYFSELNYELKIEKTAPVRAHYYSHYKFISQRYLTFNYQAKHIGMPKLIALPLFYITSWSCFIWRHIWVVLEDCIWYINLRPRHVEYRRVPGHNHLQPVTSHPSLRQRVFRL